MEFRAINPATGNPAACAFAADDEPTLERKLQQAAAEARRWRESAAQERTSALRRAAELLDRRREEFASLMAEEMGKPITQGLSESDKCAWVCRYYAEHGATHLEAKTVATDAGLSFVECSPLGVVLAVMPWNFPFWQVFRFAAPALMAGNVGLLKHASNVPGCALAIEGVFREAGLPEGCFQTLLIGGARAERLVGDPRIAAATLTGSEPAGMAVATAAGRALKKVVLELGGSDPFIVLEDADVERAAEVAVTARMINSGQSCIAAKRFLLHTSIAERFTRRMVEKVRALRVGDPLDPATEVGPLAREDLLAELHQQVTASLAGGANCLVGGHRVERPGFFYAPTVLDRVSPGLPVAAEETFGPVAAILTFESDGEALALANGTPFGLGASLWTRDLGRARELVEEIEAGSVFVNGMVKSDPRLPFGGVKRSGYGRELGAEGIREFVNVKTVWMA
ncbi:MAG: NAD-dependent succinate-semialdehyde dehydrogenase [Acidobacteria bacterium]|nr:NAD-dependent succinate-semialdehyde dehydrogenase [Acidobacteriota bacterium]MCU0254742.1 NAD-dependent succinate-semialdehyde dehydrogenase [Acidobacteriota bacterium]